MALHQSGRKLNTPDQGLAPEPDRPVEEPVPPPPPERVAAIVISRNQRAALHRCLAALAAGAGQIKTLVVDLGSRDGSLDAEDAFPDAQFIKLPKNFGITKGLNLGIRAANAEIVLLMSEPVEIAAHDVVAMANKLDAEASIGALCPLLVSETGEPAAQVRSLPTPTDPDPSGRSAQPGESVECASGAAIMVRRFLLTSLQKLDERYGDYGSDAELCAQVHRAGKKVVIDDVARGRVTAEAPAPDALQQADHQLGTAAYLGKHHGFVTGILAHLKFILGSLVALPRFRYLITGQKIDGTQ